MERTGAREYVMELLKSHNALVQEHKTLLYERAQLEQLPQEDTIEAMVLAYGQGERVDSGKISDKTQDVALTYQQKHQAMKAPLLAEVDLRIRQIEGTLHRLDFYMDGLEAYQASILRDYYFEGYTWRDLQDLRGVTYKTLMKHRNDALAALVLKYARLEQMGLLDIEQDMEQLHLK